MKKNSRLVKFLVILITIIFSLSAEFFYFEDCMTVKAASDGVVTAGMLNVRSGAGTKYSIIKSGSTLVRLAKGTRVSINSTKSNWYNISFTYNGKNLSGYVSKSYISKSASTVAQSSPTVSGTAATVTASSLNVRTGPSTSNSILKKNGTYVRLKKGVSVNIVSTSGSWYKISFNFSGSTLTGYVLGEYISTSSGGSASSSDSSSSVIAGESATTTADSLNVRTGAGTSYNILTNGGRYVKLTKNSKINIIGTSGSWYKISFSYSGTALTGYVSSMYVTKDAAQPATPQPVAPTQAPVTVKPTPAPVIPTVSAEVMGVTTADKLNIRTGEGTSFDILKSGGSYVKLTKGTTVAILGSNGSWYNIQFVYGSTVLSGYASSTYIDITSGSLATQAPEPTQAPETVVTPTESPVQNGIDSVQTPDTSATSNQGRVTADTSLNVRTGAGTTYSILTYNNQYIRLAFNTVVTIEREESGWYYIAFSYAGQNLNGYVSATYIEKIASETPSETPVETPSDNGSTEPAITVGNVTASVLNVRTGAGTSNSILTYDSQNVRLSTGASVKIIETLEGWYKVEFNYNNTTLTGYVCSDYIKILSASATDADFEAKLTAQGFPESYKVLLRQLHADHPNWEFQAFNTGLDWDTVIAKESIVGVNLIPSSKNVSWKSLETGAYSWASNSFVPYDGSSWVSASKSVIAYYMDPRNFLYDTTAFQFELLSYQQGYQTRDGVEAILKNTAMYNTQVPYVDSATASTQYMAYSDIFMAAAAYSGVSPYHLASRVKQEVVTGSTSLSNSVSGTVAGYEGYYNYFNIGAYNSTVALGAIKNGLNYAKNGTSSAATNDSYMIPWTDPYRAIVGGSKFISASYIARGQNTIYLEKFNVTSRSTYNHQYMSNVQAAWSESVKVASAYQQIENYNSLPIVFSIPVYNNMPSTPCSLPADAKNPNNWLKSLSVSGYSLTPTFNVNSTQEYSVIVGGNVSSVSIAATPVYSKATVTGAGTVSISQGTNRIEISVKAENGDVRKYILNVIKQ